MKKFIDIAVRPSEAADSAFLSNLARQEGGLSNDQPLYYAIRKQSIDARGRQVKVRLRMELSDEVLADPEFQLHFNYPDVHRSREVIIVGFGPAGMFAALRLIELGYKPVIYERGQDVRGRRRDLAAINKFHEVNPESNYCFGEGGAGTYSDGKLYTRSKKRGDLRRILEILVRHGATEKILVEAHPHIGTNKLPKVVQAIRETILQAGGEIHFNARVDDFLTEGTALKGVRLADGTSRKANAVILATGHSARDIFSLLYRKGIAIEAKPFALGLRVEHPQHLIDRIQYHGDNRGAYLPAAAYSLVHQARFEGKQHGVFSFCMCPGGFIVPSATAPGEVVVNGMSPSRRDSRFANSGIVVAVDEEAWKPYASFGPLAGMYFQAAIEQKACQMAGGKQTAPAQGLLDFVRKKASTKLPESSYQPGLEALSMDELLPEWMASSLRQGFKAFGKKMRGFLTEEAVLVGVESRTSSPVRIPRDSSSLQHPQIEGLFPSGEGPGYAGGIVSAAMDGERVAEAVASYFRLQKL